MYLFNIEIHYHKVHKICPLQIGARKVGGNKFKFVILVMRRVILMNMLANLNKAMDYIEQNLLEDIDFQQVAKISLCSEYHLKRMFSFLAGIPLSEYIRNRRLTLAAMELKEQNRRVLDIAVKYGYQSSDSFTRAFHKLHGVLPSEVKTANHRLQAYPKMSFQLTVKGTSHMEYRIVEKAAFQIIGLKKRVPIQFKGVNPEIAKMWQSLNESMIQELKQMSDVEPLGLISASTNFSEQRMEEAGELDHYIGVATNQVCPQNWEALEVASGTWGVFEASGKFPDALQDVWGRIYAEWFPASNYEQINGPEILWNESKNIDSPHFRSEIWIPLKKREDHR
jgi:AraC family transcriptional regulator